MIGLLTRWFSKGYSSLTYGSLFIFIQVSQGAELIESVELYLKDGHESPFVGDTGKPLHIHSGLLGDRDHQVDAVVLIRR